VLGKGKWWEDEVGDEIPDVELPEMPLRYVPLFVQQLIPLKAAARMGAGGGSGGRDADQRVLLVASFGSPCDAHPPETTPASQCSICGMWSCFRTDLSCPLEVHVPARAPFRLGRQGYQKICNATDRLWDRKIQDEYSWLQDSFQRAWHCGIGRQELCNMINSWPPLLDSVMRSACGAIDVLIKHKRKSINKAVLLQSYELSEAGLDQPCALSSLQIRDGPGQACAHGVESSLGCLGPLYLGQARYDSCQCARV
jgi:hypothetical protein